MISMAALSFLIIIAAALGSQASIIPDSKITERLRLSHRTDDSRFHYCIHRPADCCFSYTSRTIRCKLMRSYFETSGGCPQPGVIFITKNGQRVCADPRDERVQYCMSILTRTPPRNNLQTLQLA
ncbi:PREDICTED: C-C motif chemokine 23 isoform X2 [Chinchilla lanigera]|uniref:C-C motif chemokine 23 isoform X2 n=1 Tax=Chinchilla lanigera TaxID=34839 RepID=UPI00038E9D0D|nr:PREDICTED: C-C motif chemokine 23 isoform X2 [Chinchilla lanigera]